MLYKKNETEAVTQSGASDKVVCKYGITKYKIKSQIISTAFNVFVAN